MKALVDFLDLLAEAGNQLHVIVTLLFEAVRYDSVESLALTLQLIEKPHVHRRGKEESVEHFARFNLGVLNRLTDRNLLVARKKLNLTHLMQIHADGILDYFGRMGFRRFLILRVDEFLHVFLAQNLNAERLENFKISVGLDGVDDIGRKNLIQLFVRDITAVRLAAVFNVVDHVVEFGLSENRHALHRRKNGIGVDSGFVFISDKTRQRLGGRQIRITFPFGGLFAAFLLFNFSSKFIGVELIDIKLGIIERIQLGLVVFFATATRFRGFVLIIEIAGNIIANPKDFLRLFCFDRTFFRRFLRRICLRNAFRLFFRRFFYCGHISPVYNSPICTLSNVCLLYHKNKSLCDFSTKILRTQVSTLCHLEAPITND